MGCLRQGDEVVVGRADRVAGGLLPGLPFTSARECETRSGRSPPRQLSKNLQKEVNERLR